MANSNNSPEIDKDHLYGEFQRTQRWRDNLSRKLAHKSLDIPDDDMDITIQKGVTWKEIVAVVAGGVIGMAAWSYFKQPPPVQPPSPPAVDHDTTRRVDIEKWIPPAE